MRNITLCNAEDFDDLPPLQFPVLDCSEYVNADLSACVELELIHSCYADFPLLIRPTSSNPVSGQ